MQSIKRQIPLIEGGRYAFITNNGVESVKDYAAKMYRLGLK